MVDLAPVPARERIDILDVLRGFALLGVLVANALWYFSGFAELSEQDVLRLPANPLDPAVFELERFFVSGKFITIFSFLFGMGFALQMRRAEEAGAPVKRLYRRRMTWLLAFGIAHALLAFYGDVLHLYALLGLLLIGWVTRSEKALICWGLAFAVVLPVAVRALQWALPALTEGAIDPEAMTEARRERRHRAARRVCGFQLRRDDSCQRDRFLVKDLHGRRAGRGTRHLRQVSPRRLGGTHGNPRACKPRERRQRRSVAHVDAARSRLGPLGRRRLRRHRRRGPHVPGAGRGYLERDDRGYRALACRRPRPGDIVRLCDRAPVQAA